MSSAYSTGYGDGYGYGSDEEEDLDDTAGGFAAEGSSEVTQQEYEE